MLVLYTADGLAATDQPFALKKVTLVRLVQ